MDLTGEYKIAAPREAVWKALNDPEILKQSIPGCEEIEKLSDTEMTAKVDGQGRPGQGQLLRQGDALRSRSAQRLQDHRRRPGRRRRLRQGRRRRAPKPDETGHGTMLTYTATAAVGGKLAQIGSRLIDGTARKLADEFFGKFSTLVSAQSPAAAATSRQLRPRRHLNRSLRRQDPARRSATRAAAAKGLHPVIWIGA